MSEPDIESLSRGYKAKKFNSVVVVVERLADTHHYDSADPLARISADDRYLTQNFGCGEVAHPAAQSGGAKAASHAAACLTRYAYRVSVLVFHKNAFDALAVSHAH